MYTHEQILNYRCPRWNDWPNLGLYMDQVISLLEESVALFYPDDQKAVTSTMINNYVKQKIVMPSQNKKYKRDHLAHLYILFLLKPALNLTDICNGISCLIRNRNISESYDMFCDAIESAIATAFGNTDKVNTAEIEGIELMHSISMAFSYTMLARLCINAEKPAEETKKIK